MKARVKETGKIVDVEFVGIVKRDGIEMNQYSMIDVPYYFVSSELDFNDTIDWEQRRYEIARDLYVRYDTMDTTDCVRSADELIKQLKKNKK